METYFVQVQLGDLFEDLYVKAHNVEEALCKAKHLTSIKHRFANFVI